MRKMAPRFFHVLLPSFSCLPFPTSFPSLLLPFYFPSTSLQLPFPPSSPLLPFFFPSSSLPFPFPFPSPSLEVIEQYQLLDQVALKFISLGNHLKSENRLRREIHFLTNIHHPNVVKLYESFKFENFQVLVLERIRKGELLSYIKSRGYVSFQPRSLFFPGSQLFF